MPVRIAVQTRMAENVVCHCSACDQRPDPRYPEFGGMVDDEDFGHWWCEWCLSCCCHEPRGPVDADDHLVPACSMERFGFTDSDECRCSPDEGITCSGPNYCPGIVEEDPVQTCEFCGTEAVRMGDGVFEAVRWIPYCTCQKDLRDRINGQVAE